MTELSAPRASRHFSPAVPRPGMFAGVQCTGAPPAPGTGSTPDELMAQARVNGAIAEQHNSGGLLNLLWFYKQVRNQGPWDYKQYSKSPGSKDAITGYEPFGNYNYGYTGAAAGYPLDLLLRQAGRAQVTAKSSQPGFGKPGWPMGLVGGVPPYGDDPTDQARIIEGYHDRKKGC